MSDTILVTGGAGFIGSHLVERLLADGHEVFVLDNLSTGRIENVAQARKSPRLQLVVDSILNWPVTDVLTKRCNVVYHLAAAVGVKKIMEEPVETITTNVRGTEIVLDCCHRHSRPLLLASTSEIYGKAGSNLHEEHDRIEGSITRRRWAYACTKALDEFLALAYHQEKGLSVVIARFFNIVGPRQTGQYGMVLPTFVRQALDSKPITVHGSGDQRRSFCYVGDAVEAMVRLMRDSRAFGQVLNIGDEHEISIRQLAERVKTRTGSSSPIACIPYEEVYGTGFEDMDQRQPNTKRIRDLVGWRPTLDIDAIIDEVVQYFQTLDVR